MGSNHDIHKALFQVRYGLFLLRRGPETAQQIHAHREILHTLDEGVVMLLGQNRGRHQIDHLLVFLNRLESRPDRDLRLSIAHVAADQAVHDLRAFHVLLGGFDGKLLIRRLLKGKQLLKLRLPDRIGPVGIAVLLLPGRVELHQILRHLLNGSPDSRFRSRPLAAAQPVQLRLSGIRSGVFLNHLQLGRQDVKVAALGVLDLDVVLHDLVYFYLLDSPVDAKAVILMDHVVSGLQLGKALYLLAFIDLFLFPFLPFPSENIGLGKHRKADQRVFVAPVQASVHHHYFRWIYHPVRVLAVKAVQLLFLQIRRQSFGPGPGSAHQNHGIFFPFPSLQIFHQHLKAVVVGIDRPGLHLIPLFYFPFRSLLLHQAQGHAVFPVQAGYNLFASIQKPGFLRQGLSALRPVRHTLLKFFLDRPSLFQKPRGLIKEKHGLFRIKIVQKADGFLFFPGHRLRRRINHNLLKILHGALALRVKAADGVHLVVPEFDTPGRFLCQRKNIHDTAPDRELARHLHLPRPLIAEPDQLFGQRLDLHNAVLSNRQDLFLHTLQRAQPVHQSVKGGDHRNFFLRQKSLQRPHSLLHQQISLNIRMEEEEILCLIQHGFPVKIPAVLMDFPGLLLTVGQDHPPGEPLPQAAGRVDLLRVHTSGQQKNAPVLFQALFQFFIYSQLLKWFQKGFHLRSFLLYRFMASSVFPCTIRRTASAAFANASSTSFLSSAEKRPST